MATGIVGAQGEAVNVATCRRVLEPFLHELSESLGRAIDAKDPCTSTHSEEVATVSHALALALRLSPGDADIIHIAGHLHDIGKIGVPDAILFKAGPLTQEEWAVMRRHPGMGAEMLRPVAALQAYGIPVMVEQHHERFDGKGYPSGLGGRDIHPGARIIAVADGLSAMMQRRTYREAWSFDEAFAEIRRCAGTQYDPEVVSALQVASGPVRAIMGAFADAGVGAIPKRTAPESSGLASFPHHGPEVPYLA